MNIQLMNYKILVLILMTLGYNVLKAQNIGIKLNVGSVPNTTLDINGAVSYREGTPLSISNGTNNNVNLDSMSFYRITAPTAVFTLTGFTNGQNGRLLFLINSTSYNMTLSNQSTSSSAANRINTGSGADLVIGANGMVTLIYNSTLQKWVVWAKSGEKTDWSLTGNSGTTAGTNFIGTTDAQGLMFKTNNQSSIYLPSEGRGGIIEVTNRKYSAVYESLLGFKDINYPSNIDTSFIIRGAIGLNDFYGFRGVVKSSSTATEGEFHIISGDDGNEPIIFEQYDQASDTYTERMRIQNDGTTAGVDIANHLAVGSNSSLNTYTTASIDENYTSIPTQTTTGLSVQQIRTEASPTSASIMKGIDATTTYRMSGNTTSGIGSTVKGTMSVDGNYGFNSLMAGDFEAFTTSNSANQRQLIGSYGLAQHNGTGTITEATGMYADVTMGNTGTITEAAGLKGWAFLNNAGNITTAIGIRGGAAKGTTSTGAITTGMGIYADSYNAATNYGLVANAYASLSGTYTNTYGGSFSAYSNHASATLTNVYGVRSASYKNLGTVTNGYAGYFDATGGSTTNYGLYSNVGNSATNNYAYYGSLVGGSNTDWGVYMTGEDKNYFSSLVGIGTTSPGAGLHVASSSSGLANDMILAGHNDINDMPVLNIRRSRGTEASPTNLTLNSSIGGIHYYGYVSGGWSYLSSVNAYYKGNGTTNLSNLTFNTSNSERMVIDEYGNIGIGCNAPQYNLHVIGTLGVSTSIRTPTSTAGATTACSDIRYKKNITPLSNVLEKVLKIQGVTYDWRINEFPDWKFSSKNQIGVIAQDLEKIYPELVDTDEKGYKSVDYSKITPILVEAIKEQQTTIESQKKEIDSLKKQANSTQQEVDILKKQLEQFSNQLEALVKKQN